MRGRFQPRLQSEMHTLTHRRVAGKKHGKPAVRVTNTSQIGIARFLIEAVPVLQELRSREASIKKRFNAEVRSAEQKISLLVLLFFPAKNVFSKGVLVIRGKQYANPLRFLLHGLIRITSVRVRAFENGWNPQASGNLQSSQRSVRPGVDNVNLPGKFFDAPRDDVVVQCESPHRTQQFVRYAKLPARKCGLHPHLGGNWPLQNSRKHQKIGSRSSQAIHLLPCGITNPVCTQLVWKAVEHPHWFVRCAHEESADCKGKCGPSTDRCSRKLRCQSSSATRDRISFG